MEVEGQLISWSTFKAKFLHKYFPADLKRKKEMEFLRLEQGNMSVGEYAAKFEELARFCPYSELEVDRRSKCSKFELGLRPKLKIMFGHQEIADFATLVNKCRIYEDNLKANELATPGTNFPRDYGPQRNHRQGRGKERVEGDRKPFAAIIVHRDRSFQRFCPKLDRKLNVIHAEEAKDHGRVVTPSGTGTSSVHGPTRGKLHGGSVDTRNDVPAGFYRGNGLACQSWKSRLSKRFSPERERITWEGEILGYIGRFSLERELPRRGEKWQSGAVDTMRFSPERESLA
ncbi:hypothetical protein Lal_00041077 [Lupinus albus]|nr:hypothetical protein Lal_00041077 [Lupinus albus]